jgi:hypothetical protein
MTILDRLKAPRKPPKPRDVLGRLAGASASATDGLSKDATPPRLDVARDQLYNALELTLEKVRESAALAKLQDEARRQLGDALELIRDKVQETAPQVKEKLEEAREEVMQRLPHKRRGHSKLGMLMVGLVLGSAAIGVGLALKKKFTSPNDDALNTQTHPGSGHLPNVPPSSGSNESTNAGEWLSSPLGESQAHQMPVASSNPPGTANPLSAQTKSDMPDASTAERLNALLGKDVVDLDGTAIGQIIRIYHRVGEGQPEWAVISGGLIAEKMATVPLAGATIDEKVQVAYRKEQIEQGIDFEADEITVAQEMEAGRHYNLRRETGTGASPNSVLTDNTLHAWPPGFKRQEAN